MDLISILAEGLRSAVGPNAAVYALAAIGLNVHFGYTGLLNFGQAGFMLVGAYGLAVTVTTFGQSMWLGLLIGLLCSAALALILGVPTLRLRSDYLAITTIAAAEILRFAFRSPEAEPVTGGVFMLRRFAGEFYALNPFPAGDYGIGRFTFSARSLWFMTACWFLVVLVTVLVFLLIHSPWGRVIKAIREDEDAVRSLGKNVFSYKTQSLVLGGVIGGIGGMMFAIDSQSLHPDNFQPIFTFYLYVILVLGGAARVMGPILGSVVFWFLFQVFDALLRRTFRSNGAFADLFTLTGEQADQLRFALVGLGLVLLMAFRPAGILGHRRELMLGDR